MTIWLYGYTGTAIQAIGYCSFAVMTKIRIWILINSCKEDPPDSNFNKEDTTGDAHAEPKASCIACQEHGPPTGPSGKRSYVTHAWVEGVVHRLGQRVASEPDKIESPYILGPPPVLIVPMPMAERGAAREEAESETGTDDEPEQEYSVLPPLEETSFQARFMSGIQIQLIYMSWHLWCRHCHWHDIS